MQQTEGIIFLADKREHFQTENFRSFTTIPKEETADIFNEKFSNFLKFSDNTLAAQRSCILKADSNYCVVLLPLVGAIEVKISDKNRFVDAGEVAFLFVKENDEITIENPYENDLVNYLEIWFKTNENQVSEQFFDVFDLTKNQNSLNLIQNQDLENKIFIGKYDGRKDEVLKLDHNKTAFGFVISGAFEFQNRLVESRDAVALWNCHEIDFEALANESILLLITS